MIIAALMIALAGSAGQDRPTETVESLLTRADAAACLERMDEALRLASRAVALHPRNAAAYLFRGRVYEFQARHPEAVADFSRAIGLQPTLTEAYERRGAEEFRQGRVADSIVDFDRVVALQPAAGPVHWRRGISYYYAGRFEDGRRQFEASGRLNTNDVENALWQYLCAARASGIQKARTAMREVGQDPRVPMRQLHELYRGSATSEDVLAAARAGNPAANDLREHLFYAHLYLGLHAEVAGDKLVALEHVRQAVKDYGIAGYMGDVARVHLRLRTGGGR